MASFEIWRSSLLMPAFLASFFVVGAGKGVFDCKVRADKGLRCNDCHAKICAMTKGAKIMMADMNAGKNCGECHSGTKAFASRDEANCRKRYKK